VARQCRAELRPEGVQGDAPSPVGERDDRDNPLAPLLVRRGNDNGIGDPPQGEKRSLDGRRVHLERPGDDDVIRAPEHRKPAVGPFAQVGHAKPASATPNNGSIVAAVGVTIEQDGARDEDPAVGIQLHLDAEEGTAVVGAPPGGLGGAVGLDRVRRRDLATVRRSANEDGVEDPERGRREGVVRDPVELGGHERDVERHARRGVRPRRKGHLRKRTRIEGARTQAHGGVSAEHGANEDLGSANPVGWKGKDPAARTAEPFVRRLRRGAERGAAHVRDARLARRPRGGDRDARNVASQRGPESPVRILGEARISHPPSLCVPRLSAMTRTASRLGAAAIAMAVVALAACAPQEIYQPAVTQTLVPVEHRSVVPSPPVDPRPEVVWPLTGLDASAAAAADTQRQAIAVKIDNSTGEQAIPQEGLQHADIVFEEYMATGGWTRFVAVFQSNYPEIVGNSRSMRPMDPYIFGSFYGTLVFSGAAAQTLKEALAITDQVYVAEDLLNCRPAFYQKSGKHRPYATYIHLEEAAKCGTAKGALPAPQQFDYAYPDGLTTAIMAGTPVSTIDLKFSHTQDQHWNWDAASGKWLRFQGSTPHVQQDGQQISATNILVLRAAVRYKISQDPETLLAGTVDGTGYIAAGGKYLEIRWSKADRRDTFHLTTLDGGPVYLQPGNTWVELLPNAGTRESQVLKFDSTVITTGP